MGKKNGLIDFIHGLLGPDIDKNVRTMDKERQGERSLPFVQIAKEYAAHYRKIQQKNSELPVLSIQDFKDYLRWQYLVGSPMFNKLASKN